MNFCTQFYQDGPVPALNVRHEVPRNTIASTFVPTGLVRADEPTVDLHVFAGRSFDIEAAFESFSSPRAIELSDAPGCFIRGA